MRNQKWTVVAIGCSLALSLAGLASSSAVASDQFKTAAGARLVENTMKPRDGIITPKLTELWSVGDDKDAEGVALNRPFEVRVAADGRVFVLDWGDTCIRVFDDKGKFLRQIGRKGQGPGDMETPAWFDIDAAGNIFLTDSRNMRVSRFDQKGEYISSFRLEKFSSLIRVDRSGRLFLSESARGTPELDSEFTKIQNMFTLVRSDKDGKNPVRIGPFQADMMLMMRQGESMISLGSPDLPTTGWGVAPDGRIWAGYNGSYEIGVYDPDGNPLFRFGREFRPIKKSVNPKVSVSEASAKLNQEFLPAFVQDFFFDDAGNGWFRLFRNEPDEKAKEEPYLYDVFSPEGVYLKQIVVPFRIYQVRNGKMYTIVENEDGFRVLKCYRFE